MKVAVASGLSNAKIIMDKIRAKEADYHFVEIMCCPGGCVNGGGQPQVHADVRNFEDVKAIRAKVLYDNDAAKTLKNLMRIRPSNGFTANISANREVRKRIIFFIQHM